MGSIAQKWGYCRVSTAEQNLARQIEQMKDTGIPERNIRCDKSTGRNFDRREYNALVGTKETAPLMRKGDLLIISSLDRLGRNYAEIREQWNIITNVLEVDIQVLDMPMLNTRDSEGNLDKRFVADLVLQILSYVAQKELENIRKRQQQGIAVMPIVNGKKISLKTGKATGRPEAKYPSEWDKYYTAWKNGELTAKKCIQELNLKKATFYNLIKRYESR